MKTDIIQFKDNAPVRMQMVKGEPWFVAKDVCKILGLERTDSSVRRLDDDEKGTHITSTLGGKQEMTTQNGGLSL